MTLAINSAATRYQASLPVHAAPIEWRQDPDAETWDAALANLGGHPLQSALWGDARRAVDGIRDQRWMALRAGNPVWMVRLEERVIPFLGRVAWAPRGPTGQPFARGDQLPDPVSEALKGAGIVLAITDPWQKLTEDANGRGRPGCRPQTIWIDVGAGRDQVWNGLNKRFRQAIRRGQRPGNVTETATSAQDVARFFGLCEAISHVKGFRLPGSLPLMLRLLQQQGACDVEARLFVTRRSGRVSAGVFIIRCGRSTHFFWGGTDREHSKEGVGETAHWAAIEWSLANRCRVHDLEGIDPKRNPGVHFFKRKMGGAEVTLGGRQYHPLSRRGQLVAWLDARRG
jgi:hypothetical protein